ncbi:MAG: hypothetical protein DRG27_06580 [Deltaproteobacteria bacterium]|nr:MAG: hypothetical protein DRG27_06580 [Deltaproteobacteria bacterium]
MKDWFVQSLGALFLWGLWSFIPKISIRYIDPKTAFIFEILGAFFVAFYVLVSIDFNLSFSLLGIALSIITGIVGSIGVIFFLNAISKGPVSLVTVISSLYPAITLVLAFVFLNESVSLKQLVGIALGVFAIALIVS